MAVNLGNDTDTTAAVTGALAGLSYGIEGIPVEWLNTLAASDDIRRLAAAMADALTA
jgi:ADP-ribosylglycohydrolase